MGGDARAHESKLPARDRDRSAADATPPTPASAASTERATQRRRSLQRSTVQACKQRVTISGFQVGHRAPRLCGRGSERGNRAEQTMHHCHGPKAPNDAGWSRGSWTKCAGMTLRGPATHESSGSGTNRLTPSECHSRTRGLGKGRAGLSSSGCRRLGARLTTGVALRAGVLTARWPLGTDSDNAPALASALGY